VVLDVAEGLFQERDEGVGRHTAVPRQRSVDGRVAAVVDVRVAGLRLGLRGRAPPPFDRRASEECLAGRVLGKSWCP
jgi:hypothetical protein